MRTLLSMLPALTAALMPLAPASRATAAATSLRAPRPVMLQEVAEAVVQNGFLVSSVVDLPLMTLGDADGLLTSISALSPVAQAVYCAQRHGSNLATFHPHLARARPEPEPEPEVEPAFDSRALPGDVRAAFCLSDPAPSLQTRFALESSWPSFRRSRPSSTRLHRSSCRYP